MKFITTNIFIDNIQSSPIDEVVVHEHAQNILRKILNDKSIISKSCLKNYVLNTVCFDIVLCDNDKIQEVNFEYRSKDRPTDVITFAIFADADEDERFIIDDEIYLGEILVSIDKTKEQAEENHKTFFEELDFLITHGIFHLLGYDHRTQKEYEYLINLQNKILE